MEDSGDDFEYHLTFPSSQNLCFVNNDSDPNDCSILEPVVFLIGCKGCTDDTLAKYGCVYEEGGLTCIRYVPVVDPIFSIRPPPQLKCHAQKLVALLHDYSLDQQPLFFHVMGQTGSLVYDLMSRELQKPENNHIKVKGYIFHSAPTKTSLTSVLLAILSNTVNSSDGWVSKCATGIWKICFAWLASCCRSILGLECSGFTSGIWHRLASEKNCCPQLFIYKDSDRNADIGDFMKRREELGVATSALTENECKDKDSYCTHVLGFVERCLET